MVRMTQIDPFPGYRYAASSPEELTQRLSPPYDRVPPKLRAELWNRHPENVVRVTLPPPAKGEIDLMTQASTDEGWYEKAGERFDEWLASGKLVADEAAIYPYRQVFVLDGENYERWGFLAALRLDMKERALAHEQTFEGPKADRFRLMTACKANTSPIFTIFEDPDGIFHGCKGDFGEPVLRCQTDDGQEHSLFRVSCGETADRLMNLMKDRRVFIADGHHRYETALRYCESKRQEEGVDDSHPANWILAYFCPVSDAGLRILPTHRVVQDLPEGWLEGLESHLPQSWKYTTIDSDVRQALESVPSDHIAIGVSDGERHRLLSAPCSEVASDLADQPEPLRGLSVVTLHGLLLGRFLGLSEPKPGQIRFVKGERETLEEVSRINAQGATRAGAFILPPVDVADVLNASSAGCRMPPKSTDFFPKLPTGLVFRLLRP